MKVTLNSAGGESEVALRIKLHYIKFAVHHCFILTTLFTRSVSLRRCGRPPFPKLPLPPVHYQLVERKRPDLLRDREDTHG